MGWLAREHLSPGGASRPSPAGIGRALVVAANDVPAGLGARRVSALVERDHAWAVGFWVSLRDPATYRRDPAMLGYICDVGQRRTASTP
jgi:hypothetical protein